MSYAVAILLAVVVPLVLSWVSRDAYACFPLFQKFLFRIAAHFLQPNKRAAAIEQWSADMADLPPSELYRIWFALDLLRGALLIRWEAYQEDNAVLVRHKIKMQSLLEQGEYLKRKIIEQVEVAKKHTLDDEARAKNEEFLAIAESAEVQLARLREAIRWLDQVLSLKGRASRLLLGKRPVFKIGA